MQNLGPANEKYLLLHRENLKIPIQMRLSQKEKTFSEFFHAFSKSKLNFKHFQKKDDPHRFCIFEVTDSENVVRQEFKKSHFRGCLDKQYCKRAQALLKSPSHHLDHIHRSLPRKLSRKKSLLLTCKIMGLLVNTLAADEKYFVLHRDNLTIPNQMQLSEKQKTFFSFFASFLKSAWNFEHFEKKMTLSAFAFPKLRSLKTWLSKCLKSLVSEDAWTSNMVNVPKHC